MNDKLKSPAVNNLFKAILTLENIEECYDFFEDLCTIAEIKEMAKTKTIQALNSVVYRSLKEANTDFNDYLDSLIGTALYDVKHEK